MSTFLLDFSGEGTPKRGDLVHTFVGNKRERTWLVLRVERMRTKPKGVPRFKLWIERWWELEPEFRMRLFRSAERSGGQGVIYTHRYPARKKKTFEQHMRRAI